MSLDDIHDLDDYSDFTLRALIDRLQRSTTDEHFIYRETELDEVWRVVDIELKQAEKYRKPEAERLREIKGVVMAAHDLVGVDGKPLEAAEALKTIMAER